MQGIGHRALGGSIAGLCLVLAACGPGPGDDDGGGGGTQHPFPATSGIQQGLSLSTLELGGWVVCHEDAYDGTGATMSGVLASCVGPYLMLACRTSVVSDTLALAAADTRAVVLQPDAATASAHHVANGVGWYFTDTASWGFFPATETVNRAPCDAGTAQADRRLCWHLNEDAELAPGYRCGDPATTGAAWRRLVLVHP